MKFFVEKAAFLKALSHGQNIVEKKTTIPILSHILLQAQEDKLFLTTTDFNASLQETIPGKVDIPGAICVSAHLMHDIVRKLSDRSLVEVEANLDNNQIVIKSGRSRFELSYLEANDFPQITQTELIYDFVLTKTQIKEIIDQTEASMYMNDARFNVHGLLLHAVTVDGQAKLRFVSTDYHRMACVEINAPAGSESIPETIIDRKTIMDIKKLLDAVDDKIHIGLSESRIEVSMETTGYKGVFSARLVEGVFPDYITPLSLEHNKVLVVPRADFLQAVDRVGTVVNEKLRAITITLKDNLARLSVVSTQLGAATEEIDVDFPYSDEIELCVDYKYIYEALQTIHEEEVECFLTNAQTPVKLKGMNNTTSTFVLMPLGVE